MVKTDSITGTSISTPTNPLERVNAEIKRRTDLVGNFPNEAAITRLVGALLLEQSDEWQLQRRYMQLEGLQLLADNQAARLSAVGCRQLSTSPTEPELATRTPRAGTRSFCAFPLRSGAPQRCQSLGARWRSGDDGPTSANAAKQVRRSWVVGYAGTAPRASAMRRHSFCQPQARGRWITRRRTERWMRAPRATSP